MGEFEIFDAVGDIAHNLEGLEDAAEGGETGISAEDLSSINEEFNGSFPEGNLNLSLNEDGKITNSKGEPVDSNTVREKMLDGDIKGALEDLGIDVSDENFETSIESEETEYKKSEGFKQRENLNTSEKLGDDIEQNNDLSEDVDTDSLSEKEQEVIEKIKEAKADLIESEEKPGGAEEKGKTWGESLKDGVEKITKFALLALTAAEVAELIKKHQKEMNGCWIVNSQTGDKCKISYLQCGDDADTNNACAFNIKDGSGGSAVPKCNTPTSFTDICKCGKSKNEYCLDPKICLDDKAKGATTSTTCNVTLDKICQLDKEAKNDTCPAGCDGGTGNLPPLTGNLHYKCVKVSFWSAAADWTENTITDLAKKVIDIGGNILGDILKKFWPVLLVVFIGFIIFAVFNFYISNMESRNLSSKIQQIELSKMKTQQFNFTNNKYE